MSKRRTVEELKATIGAVHEQMQADRTVRKRKKLKPRRTRTRVKRVGSVRKYITGGIMKSIYTYFDDKWPDVNIETTEKIAKQVKPDTAFNKFHFAWYKNDYKNKRDIP